MKRVISGFLLVLGMIAFLGAGIGYAQDDPKTGCPVKACFDKMDADKSGEISEAEFLEKCKAKFVAMDTDKNGSLNKDELKPCCMKYKHKKKGCPFKKEGAGE